jgi:hypothetical protein
MEDDMAMMEDDLKIMEDDLKLSLSLKYLRCKLLKKSFLMLGN